jgi:cathepsin L
MKLFNILMLFLYFVGVCANFDHFRSWMRKYDVTYKSYNQLTYSYDIWKNNYDKVNEHNSKNTFQLEMNRYGDKYLCNQHIYANRVLSSQEYTDPELFPYNINNLPKSVDWRNKSVVTNIKDQGQCGSCWAFSTVGSIEGQHALKTGHLVSLSESQIVDCCHIGGVAGCGGGFMTDAFQCVMQEKGLDTESSYPYVPLDENCALSNGTVGATIKGYVNVTGGEHGLQIAVATVGPISVAIDASGFSFQMYKSGVYYEPECSPTFLDHAVLVVGYGTTNNGTDYWVVKNSWGQNWGENGYIRMSRNRDNNCGIATIPSYPLV